MLDMHAKLVAKDSITPCREISLDALPLRIGRSPNVDACVEDRWVSREHCEIELLDGRLVVRDLDSKYGTFVNGQRIIEKELHDGDDLNIGLSRFCVQIEEPARKPSKFAAAVLV